MKIIISYMDGSNVILGLWQVDAINFGVSNITFKFITGDNDYILEFKDVRSIVIA